MRGRDAARAPLLCIDEPPSVDAERERAMYRCVEVSIEAPDDAYRGAVLLYVR